MKDSLFITGATGILGSALLRRLSREQIPVIMLSRKRPEAESSAKLSGRAEWVQGDVALPRLGLSPKEYSRLAARVHTVLNLAARTDFSGRDVDAYRAVNIGGVGNVFRFASDAGAELHHVSTAFVCGSHCGEFREDQLDIGQKFRNGYEESKFLGELLLKELNGSTGLPLAIYRPSIIMERNPGPGSGSVFGPYLFLESVVRLRKFLEKKKAPDLNHVLRVDGSSGSSLPLIFDDQVADTLWHLCREKLAVDRVVHLVAREGFSNKSLEKAFNHVFGKMVARFADSVDFEREPPTRTELLLARKTEVYSRYLHLDVRFARQNLDLLAGSEALPAPTCHEMQLAFTRFLGGRSVHFQEMAMAVSARHEC